MLRGRLDDGSGCWRWIRRGPDAKVCLNPAAYSLSCPANDFLDSTDYAADTNFTATGRSATLLSFHAPAVTQLA
jgi:hypothetical protein